MNDKIGNRYNNKSNDKVLDLAKQEKDGSDIDRNSNDSCKENNSKEMLQVR